MADNNNQASVELDTDGVNEETIHVETPTEEASAFEKKEDYEACAGILKAIKEFSK